MKKIIFITLFSMFICPLTFAQKTWTNNIGVGFTLPVSKTGVDEEGADNIQRIGYGLEGTYIGYHKNGFTAKANVSVGLDTTQDFDIQGKDTNFGVFNNTALGVGWSFVRTDKCLFGVAAMLAIDLASYYYEDDEIIDSGKHDYKNEVIFATFSAGADIFASYSFKKDFGFFANVEVRYLVAGVAKIDRTDKYEKDNVTYSGTTTINNDLKGKVLVQPTLGVMWKF